MSVVVCLCLCLPIREAVSSSHGTHMGTTRGTPQYTDSTRQAQRTSFNKCTSLTPIRVTFAMLPELGMELEGNNYDAIISSGTS